jgi:uncharacterized protein YjdB
MKQKFKPFLASLLFLTFIFTAFCSARQVTAASPFSLIILSHYSQELNIGDEFYLFALSTNGKKPSFSSSNSKVASVNTYGKVTAKKSGTTIITAKVRDSMAKCKVTVRKTTIKLSAASLSLENGYTKRLHATASTGHPVKLISSKKSIATIDSFGYITSKKPGRTTITASADGTTVRCNVTVKVPTVTISNSSVSLFRNQTIKLSAASTSKSPAIWKSNKKSVAIVDPSGTVTALKNGTATISVTIDKVKKNCKITVKKPKIQILQDDLTLAPKTQITLNVVVSSGNYPTFSSSNINIATVNEQGIITAKRPGKAYIYAKEDGVKESIQIIVK